MTRALATQQPTVIYTVDLGDGNIADIEGPDGATAEELQAFIAQSGQAPPAPGAPPKDQAQLDRSGTVEEGQFGDGPDQPSRRLAPEDEAEYLRMLQGGASADQLRAFMASKGATLVNADQLVAAREKAGKINPDIVYKFAPAETSIGGSLARGAVDSALLGFADEIKGVAKGAGALLTGGDFGDAYTSSVDQSRGQFASDEEEHGWSRLAGQLLGGLSLPLGLEKAGLETVKAVGFAAGRDALRTGATMEEARVIAAKAITKRLAAEGAAYGGAYGAGSADGDIGDRLTGGVIGAAAGAGIGAGAGKVGEIISPIAHAAAQSAATRPATEAQAFVKAAERQGIDYLPADRPGALPTQWATSLTNLTLGGIPLTEAAERTVASAKAARDRIAQDVGVVRDSFGAGTSAQRGADQFIAGTADRGGKLYEAIPIKGDADATLSGTRTALADLNAGLASNPELSALISDPRLRAYEDAIVGKTNKIPTGLLDINGNPITRDVLAGGKLSWHDLKSFRTYIGEKAGQPSLQSDISQDALRKLYAGLSQDMAETAAANGPKALSAFNRANSYWRARQDRIDNVLTAILGKNLDQSAEGAFSRIQGWSKKEGGDSATLTHLFRSLPAEEADTVRASVINRLGMAAPGRQDQTQEVFSPAEFMTQWSKMSDRAKAVLFQGEHKQALNDLVTVASGMKASSKYANTSRTGIAVGAASTLSAAMANPVYGALAIAGQIGAGKLLGSTRVARWLAAYAKKPDAASALAHVKRLGTIAKAEPAIANDVLALQERLASAFVPTKIAADEPDDHLDGAEPE